MKKLLLATFALILIGAGYGGGFGTARYLAANAPAPKPEPFTAIRRTQGGWKVCSVDPFEGQNSVSVVLNAEGGERAIFRRKSESDIFSEHLWEIGFDGVLSFTHEDGPTFASIGDDKGKQIVARMKTAETMDVKVEGSEFSVDLGEPFRAAIADCREWMRTAID